MEIVSNYENYFYLNCKVDLWRLKKTKMYKQKNTTLIKNRKDFTKIFKW